MWDSIKMAYSGEQADDTPDADHALIRAIVAGDASALEKLYVRYELPLLGYVFSLVNDRILAEEVVQDVMLAVWQSAKRFRGDSRTLTWLLAIARHKAIDARGKQSVTQVALTEADGVSEPADDGEQYSLTLALRALPVEQRETLNLIFYHQLSGVEAAQVLNVAPGTIKSRLHRALTTLRHVLSSRETDYE